MHTARRRQTARPATPLPTSASTSEIRLERALPAGDYAVEDAGAVVAAVERKSLADLASTITSGKLWYVLADLAAVPHAAVVVEDRYSQVFKLDRVRPAVIADALAEAAVRYPRVPILFCETRALAQEWTYRFLAATAAQHQRTAGADRLADQLPSPRHHLPRPEPTTADVRAWARAEGLAVSDRGRLRSEIWSAYDAAHPPGRR